MRYLVLIGSTQDTKKRGMENFSSSFDDKDDAVNHMRTAVLTKNDAWGQVFDITTLDIIDEVDTIDE